MITPLSKSIVYNKKEGILRFLIFSLGRALSERVVPLLGQANCVSCPTFQRLITAGGDKEDVIITRLSILTATLSESLRNFPGKIIVITDSEGQRRDPKFCYLNENFSDLELENAVNGDLVSLNLKSFLAGSSDVMVKTRKSILHAIKSSLPVHLVGDTGTGKTLAAKLIHMSSRHDRDIVMESCGCLSTDIADSELFGHTKGAFSGATDNREGLLAEADGSILFLDEIQDLPMNLQTKLLRVLDTGEYRKLGSGKTLKTSFRLITASNMSLKELVRTKTIRKDFYYRIYGHEIRMPSLLEHMEDIPEILQAYERRMGYGRIINDYASFMHNFPGNVRELLKEAELYIESSKH